MLNSEFAHAIDAVGIAARFCRRIRQEGRIRPLTKADGSPVTNADFGSQALLVQRLRTFFASDPIMAEETAELADFSSDAAFTDELIADLKTAGADFANVEALVHAINRIRPASGDVADSSWRSRYWVIDPIDGTKGYLKGGQYAIALALIEEGQVRFGALACPEYPLPGSPSTTGSIFFSARGQGAWAIPLDGQAEPVRLSVGPGESRSDTIMCESLNHSPHGLSGQVAGRLGIGEDRIRKMDSQAKYAAVACGDADFYLRLPTSATYREAVWDHAAGVIVVEEAGGRVTDMDGQPLVWSDARDWDANHRFASGRGVVVSDGKLHDRILAVISETVRTNA
ncbi:MAG: 3'(2'),5'-bisphosphate nucleotidase [Alphaproteobacteria bacterium]|nr:3'(2'),5'-bisphosphate nucleotidase [Alphaproteobacteria bacterium]